MKFDLKKMGIVCVFVLGITFSGTAIFPGSYSSVQTVQAAETAIINGYTIDVSSVWYDEPNRTFGAAVTDPDGNYFTTTYKMVKVSSRPYQMNIYQSKNNNPWVQIGVITDEASYQIGNKKTGGFLFRKIADLAARSVGYEKMF
ncbi:hypothetical protein [Megasphaera sp. DISK 18]|uniref:hypothetical protein n=1 Tax=Megasphaera sp. DISK 18 TaxID=1776081 RepID=UPI0008071C5D|nr:hypothetical protein [Megasphaera sp. DISK 18]OBZ33172.1 hypothetical protein A0U42_01235 [Megasphaera sp. DISK 18]